MELLRAIDTKQLMSLRVVWGLSIDSVSVLETFKLNLETLSSSLETFKLKWPSVVKNLSGFRIPLKLALIQDCFHLVIWEGCEFFFSGWGWVQRI